MQHTTTHTRISRVSALTAAFLLVLALAVSPAGPRRKQLQIMTATTDSPPWPRKWVATKWTSNPSPGVTRIPFRGKPSLVFCSSCAGPICSSSVGLELEIGWLPPLITQSTNPKIQVGAPGYLDASRLPRSSKFRPAR